MSRAANLAAKLAEQAAAERPTTQAAPTPAPTSTKAAAAAPPPQAAPVAGWAGAVPRAAVQRRALNVGMPTALGIHQRLAQLTANEGIAAQDAVAEAVDAWLTAHGYPRPEVQQ